MPHTLVADRCVWPEGSLLVIGALVLCQDGAGDGQSSDVVGLGQLEAEALGVVVDELDLGELQGQETLVAAGEGRLGGGRRGGGGGDLGGGRGAAEEVVARTAEGGRAGDVQDGVGAALAGAGLGGVPAGLLETRMQVSTRSWKFGVSRLRNFAFCHGVAWTLRRLGEGERGSSPSSAAEPRERLTVRT